MFSESQGEHPLMFVGGGPRAGVTQVLPTQFPLVYDGRRSLRFSFTSTLQCLT